jgi:hypothetical protein
LKRRTWKLRLEEKKDQSNNMNAITDFYKSLKSSAEAMNKEEGVLFFLVFFCLFVCLFVCLRLFAVIN